jgi:hypothetical protein
MKYYEDLTQFRKLAINGQLDEVGYRAYCDKMQECEIKSDDGILISDFLNFAIINSCTIIKNVEILDISFSIRCYFKEFTIINTEFNYNIFDNQEFAKIFCMLPITFLNSFYYGLKDKKTRNKFNINKIKYPFKKLELQLIDYCERKIKGYDGN